MYNIVYVLNLFSLSLRWTQLSANVLKQCFGLLDCITLNLDDRFYGFPRRTYVQGQKDSSTFQHNGSIGKYVGVFRGKFHEASLIFLSKGRAQVKNKVALGITHKY